MIGDNVNDLLPVAAQIYKNLSIEASSSGLVIAIEQQTISSIASDIVVNAQNITLDATTFVNESVTQSLKYSSGTVFSNSNAQLSYMHIGNVTVTRLSDSVVLTEGVDYAVHYVGGKVYGLINKADFNVTINFTGYYARYDVIQVNSATGALSVVKGTNRKYDPEMYAAKNTRGYIEVYRAYVYGSNVELIKTGNWLGDVMAGTEYDQYAMDSYNRRAISKSLAKIKSGQPLLLASYGDSISAMQTSAPDHLTPNGPFRDRPETYFSAYPEDTKALLERFDFNDEAGQVHCKASHIWSLISAIESYGSTVTYNNFSIGGTWSGDYDSGGSAKGGLNSERLAAIVASAPELVVIAFGMNEINHGQTGDFVAAIIADLQAVGSECIVMGCPRISSVGGRATVEQWQFTNEQLYRAAISTNSAFVSTSYICSDESIGGIGMSSMNLCNCNRYNHPGYYELEQYGKQLAKLVY
jgi:hypothetical protein